MEGEEGELVERMAKSVYDQTGRPTDMHDGKPLVMRPKVAEAVRELRPRAPRVREAKGLFAHPSEFTEDERAFIVDCLKMNVPIYTIANMIQCERHLLSRYIKNDPVLTELKEAKYDNMLEEAEYQADRLMKEGNAAVVIHVLNTLGRQRWNPQFGGAGEGGGGGADRIVMGIIPEEEVAEAEKKVAEVKAADKDALPGVDPMQMAMMQSVAEDAARKVVREGGEVIDMGEVESRSPLGGESVVEKAAEADYSGYGAMGGGGYNPSMGGGGEADPWADGANSPFFQ